MLFTWLGQTVSMSGGIVEKLLQKGCPQICMDSWCLCMQTPTIMKLPLSTAQCLTRWDFIIKLYSYPPKTSFRIFLFLFARYLKIIMEMNEKVFKFIININLEQNKTPVCFWKCTIASKSKPTNYNTTVFRFWGSINDQFTTNDIWR